MVLAACLALLLLLGIAEQIATARARRAVPIRIHVNGTRGKSSVTRLIAGALREAGIPTVAKTTGTVPRLILPDGTERTVRRWGPASVREQAWLVRQAARLGARAMVAECMAIRPDLQAVSELRIISSTIGVITNVRLDHTEVMGSTLAAVAASLASTTPRNGPLISGASLSTGSSAGLQTRGSDRAAGRVDAPPHSDNLRTALEVTRHLAIDDETALRGMEKAAPDPGAAAGGVLTVAGRTLRWLDLTAANDPQSLDLLVGTGGAGRAGGGAVAGGAAAEQDSSPAHICVYNHRRDRPRRLAVFAEHSAVFRGSAAIIVTGDCPSLMLMRHIRRATAELVPGTNAESATRSAESAFVPGTNAESAPISAESAFVPGTDAAVGARVQPREVRFIPLARLRHALDDLARRHPSLGMVIFCGNTKGFDRCRAGL